MDTQKASLIISVTLVAVVLFNLAIYALAKRIKPNSANKFQIISRAFKRARNPWEEDKAKLDELSKTLAALKAVKNQEDPDETT
jgi:hypothetical protein